MVDLLLSGDRQSAYGHGFFSLKELSNYNIVTWEHRPPLVIYDHEKQINQQLI